MPTAWILAPAIEGHIDTYKIYKGNAFNGDSGNALKLNYISPDIEGFQLALSYAPYKEAVGKQARNEAKDKNLATLLMLYKDKVGAVEFKLCGAYLFKQELSKDKKEFVENAAYMLSGLMAYKQASVGVEFFDDFQKKESSLNVSLMYKINTDHKVGLGGQRVWGENNKRMVGTVGYAYQINESLSWSTEVNLTLHEGDFKNKDTNAIEHKENKGFLIVTGLRVEV